MIITPVFRVSYPNVFKAAINPEYPDNPPKFNVVMIFSEETMEMTDRIRRVKKGWGHLDEIKETIERAISERMKGKKVPSDSSSLFNPLKDGSERNSDGYGPGTFFMRAGSSQDKQPGVVDRDKTPITDGSKFYAGCYAIASVNITSYPSNKKNPNTAMKGVTCFLNNIQKVADGDSFSGRTKPSQDFQAIDIPAIEMTSFDLDL